ncbi:hypothetical protein [Pseudomonas sp. TTU2014-080ASC]|uniref:hypothetical protein n=1 Tax=Pseudomonas sp. TTU2014-080ASC TaxID=1729724 RepID=UPI000AF04101|nr:hypothetical protein [Pseudomonas sp. TTU2014-080ASC]
MKKSVVSSALLAIAVLSCVRYAFANVPPIEYAPEQITTYIGCMEGAITSDSWSSTSAEQCRNQSPAVKGFTGIEYVGASFTLEQSIIYAAQRERLVDFERSFVGVVVNNVIPSLIQDIKIDTAYSLQKIQDDLSVRFREIYSRPYSDYLNGINSLEIKSSSGMSLYELHDRELTLVKSCLARADLSGEMSEVKFSALYHNCLSNITTKNHDGSSSLYKRETFDNLARDAWGRYQQLLSNREVAAEASAISKRNDSLTYKVGNFIYHSFFYLLFALGFAVGVYFTYSNAPSKGSGSSKSYSRRDYDDSDDISSSPRSNDHPANSLMDFQQRYIEVGGRAARNGCGSCIYWSGERVPHPVSGRSQYVLSTTTGNCMSSHPGSRAKNVGHKHGQYCKHFESIA